MSQRTPKSANRPAPAGRDPERGRGAVHRGSLDGKRAVITGGAGGIGAAIAVAFIDRGATVLIADSDREALRAATARIEAQGESVDVANERDVERLLETAAASLGGVDILVNSAGIGPSADFLELTAEVWQQVLAVNLTGTFLCGQRAARLMVNHGTRGSIVNIASIAGSRASIGRGAYGPSKAGVIGLTRQMAVELARYGIRVNSISPGPVHSERLPQSGPANANRLAYRQRIPLRRYATVDEIAAAALYLCSDAAGFVTGHDLVVDGGYNSAGLIEADDANPRLL